jgi:hypothetical protein
VYARLAKETGLQLFSYLIQNGYSSKIGLKLHNGFFAFSPLVFGNYMTFVIEKLSLIVHHVSMFLDC